MNKNLITGIGIAAVMLAAMSCGGGSKASTTTQESAETKALVKTEKAVLEDVEQYADFTSTIQAFQENNIAPSLPVRIDKILVDVGDRISKGQVLITMDPTQYNQAAVQLAYYEADYQRAKSVYDAGGISKQVLDQAETQLKVQRDQVANLKENIELRSPLTGVVTERNYDPGDLYSAQKPAILQVMQISPLKVVLAISEQYFTQVKQGMHADITVDVFNDKLFDGKVSLIYPSIDPATRTFKIEITVSNPNNELRPGMFSRARLRFGTSKGIMVQDLAVQKQMGTNDKYIYVAKDGKADKRLVTTGIQVGNEVNVLTGINEGDEVIVAGISKLDNGTPIEVKNN
jgi:RND family efflux transporter MFP subunit